ncbi:exodeoxyribonuclease III [Moheibacter stercoris]|uniref:Exodeoxyribonuclease-3 n=1 Tax=Moheibacter stercoris TaxID=1628251 RepID=A0ABV2LW09_9FLAO
MKVISYNVNGIRAAMRKGLNEWIAAAQPDVLCLQETKANEDQIADEMAVLTDLGYHSYWHSATKKGYSGVAILSKEKPMHVEFGTGIDYIDFEGRVIRADFPNFSVISVYVPSGTNMDRLDFKMKFCHDFLIYIRELRISHPNLVICGDYNICHEAIDIWDPIRNAKVSGFLPMEREWLSSYLQECDLIDSFRYFVKEPHHYSWWSMRFQSVRLENKGWRIDYNMVTRPLEKYMKRAFILPEAKHSDHCPVGVEFEF